MFDVYAGAVVIFMSIAKRQREKRKVFKWRLNMYSDGDHVTCTGSPFQTRAAKTGKARLQMVQRRVGGTVSASDDDEHSHCFLNHSF